MDPLQGIIYQGTGSACRLCVINLRQCAPRCTNNAMIAVSSVVLVLQNICLTYEQHHHMSGLLTPDMRILSLKMLHIWPLCSNYCKHIHTSNTFTPNVLLLLSHCYKANASPVSPLSLQLHLYLASLSSEKIHWCMVYEPWKLWFQSHMGEPLLYRSSP